MAQESAKKALGKITKPTKDGKAKPYTDYDNLEDSMYRAYQTNPEVYTELVGYLGKRGKIPEFDRASWLEMGLAAGRFEHPTEEGGRGRIVLRRPYYEENNRKPALASTTLHELTHAVNKELGNQYAQLMKKGEKNQFTEAYEKLMMSPKREFFGPRPTFLSGAEQLMEKLDPKWRKEESNYRATTNEGLAFAVGSSAGKERDMFLPPAHLDPTLATNLRILVDLANRSVDKKAEKFAKGGEAVNEPSVTNLIRTEAQKQGVNPDLAVQIANVESGLDPSAKNPKSSASGLFQIIDRTRKELGGDPKKRMDPLENVRLGVKLIKQNEGQLISSLGRRPTDHELYMAHLFGPTGAVNLIQADPNTPVQKAVLQFSSPKTAESIVKNNRLTGTVGDVIGQFRQKFGVKPAVQQKTAPVNKKPAPTEGPMPFQTGFDLVAQAPSYQAALAMASLAQLDEDKEEKDTETTKTEEVQPPSAAQMLAGLQMPSLQAFAKGGEAEKSDKRFSQEDLDSFIRQAAAYAGEESLVTLPYTDAQGNQLRVPASRARDLLDNLNTFFFNQEITDQTMQGPRGAQTVESGVAPVVFADVVGGKATYDIPVGEGELRLGASGAYVKPVGQPGKANVGEYEASYSYGGKRLGGAYSPNANTARLFYEQQLGDDGVAGVGYIPKQGMMNSDQVQFFLNKRFAKGGEVYEAPAVVVTPEEKPKTEAKSMLDKLLEARKEATSTIPGMAADIAASTINPVYGTAASAADFETARREGDLLGMGLAGAGMVPVFGGMVRGGGKLLQRIGKEGAGSGGIFGSKEALKTSLGDFPAQVKQAWFDLTDEALYKDPAKMEKVLDEATRLDLFKEEQINNAKEAIGLFKKKMIDEETLNTVLTKNITGPLTSVWSKLEKQIGHIRIEIPEPPKK